MTQFKEMRIPCTVEQYPEVKALLEGMGYHNTLYRFNEEHIGVSVYEGGLFMPIKPVMDHRPTVTLDELRAMAKPNDDLRLLKERVGIMERSIMGMESKINEIHKLLFEE